MHSAQRGFTLIELVVVIVILGILAAVALPRFIDLTGEALDASTQGVAAAISSASAINYGAFQANSSLPGVTRLNQNPVCTNTILTNLLSSGIPGASGSPAPGGTAYVLSGGGNCSTAGATAGCVVTATKGATVRSATATVICTG